MQAHNLHFCFLSIFVVLILFIILCTGLKEGHCSTWPSLHLLLLIILDTTTVWYIQLLILIINTPLEYGTRKPSIPTSIRIRAVEEISTGSECCFVNCANQGKNVIDLIGAPVGFRGYTVHIY